MSSSGWGLLLRQGACGVCCSSVVTARNGAAATERTLQIEGDKSLETIEPQDAAWICVTTMTVYV